MHKNTQSYQQSYSAKAAGIFLILALLVGAMPQVVMAAPSVTCVKYHNVVSGDTLSSIAVTYNVSTTELAAANDLKEPYTLFIDQRLCIPGSATTSTTTSTSTSTSKTPALAVQRNGDYLSITVANYPKKANYYVKIKKGHQDTNTPWVKIGIFRTKKNTDVQRTFRLPTSFSDPSLMTVCLKNAKSNALTCVPLPKTDQLSFTTP